MLAGESIYWVDTIDGGDEGYAIKLLTLETYLCKSGIVNLGKSYYIFAIILS